MQRWRLARGLSVRELAERANVSASFVYKLEAQRKEPSLPVAMRLAQALGVTVEQLFTASASRRRQGEGSAGN